MVKGLDLFRDHFRDFTDRYVLIGGTACDLVMICSTCPSSAPPPSELMRPPSNRALICRRPARWK